MDSAATKRLPYARLQRLAATLLYALAVAACAPQAPSPMGAAPARAGDVHLQRLRAADQEPGNWYTGGRDLGKTHHSPLATINQGNVGTLGFAWEYRTGTRRGLEATPIVVDGVMYTAGVAGRVYALDAASGAERWTFEPRIDMQYNRYACCDAVNRGVAVWQGTVYVGALDGWLYALDARDGRVLWKSDALADRTHAYASTGAPEIAGKVVVIGNSGAEYDARGHVSAFDLETGALRWRFFTVPGDPAKPFEHPELEAAARTWDPRSRWEIGGGGTPWDALVYDPDLDLLYVGTGNGAPHSQHERSPRGGDNLYLTSIVALHADTGRMAWYVQETPGDTWDYTATAPIILADLTIDGTPRKLLMQAPKNGLFYVIERATGKILSAKPYVPVNWLDKLDLATGKVTVNRAVADYSTGPKLVFPSGQGGHNWNPMAFDAKRGTVYIPAIEIGEYLYEPPERVTYRNRARNMGNISAFSGVTEAAVGKLLPPLRDAIKSGKLRQGQPDTRMRALLRAWDPVAGRTKWEFESPGGSWDRAGVLSTDSGLVFQGTGTGHLRVYNADDGALLKDIDVGTAIIAAPMTYTVAGVQYVAVMAGWGGAGWYNQAPTNIANVNGNDGRILAFKLGGGVTPKPAPLPPLPPLAEPPPLTADAATLQHGASLYTAYCLFCHSDSERTGSADLRRLSAASHATFKDIVLRGARLPLGMPRFDDALSEQDADAIHAHVIARAWELYRARDGAALSTATQSAPSH